jgi:hypothetical protein
MTFLSYLFYHLRRILGPKGGENIKGLQSSPFLAINAKGEKILSPKQKDRTTHHFKKIQNERFNWHSQNLVFKLVFKAISN